MLDLDDLATALFRLFRKRNGEVLLHLSIHLLLDLLRDLELHLLGDLVPVHTHACQWVEGENLITNYYGLPDVPQGIASSRLDIFFDHFADFRYPSFLHLVMRLHFPTEGNEILFSGVLYIA